MWIGPHNLCELAISFPEFYFQSRTENSHKSQEVENLNSFKERDISLVKQLRLTPSEVKV